MSGIVQNSTIVRFILTMPGNLSPTRSSASAARRARVLVKGQQTKAAIVDAALHMLNDMKTFAEARVAVADDGPGAGRQTE